MQIQKKWRQRRPALIPTSLLFIVSSAAIGADITLGPDLIASANASMMTTCSDKPSTGDSCVISISKEGNTLFSFGAVNAPSSVRFSHGLYRFIYPCGTGCTMNQFVRSTQKISRVYGRVIAHDAKADTALEAVGRYLIYSRIFDRVKSRCISVDDSKTGDIALDATYAKIDESRAQVTYLDRDGNLKILDQDMSLANEKC